MILSTVGDPRAYSSAGALLKGCGLNLKEISSGKRIGEKSISKRGPSQDEGVGLHDAQTDAVSIEQHEAR